MDESIKQRTARAIRRRRQLDCKN